MRIGSQKNFIFGAACCLLALAGCSSTAEESGAGTSGFNPIAGAGATGGTTGGVGGTGVPTGGAAGTGVDPTAGTGGTGVNPTAGTGGTAGTGVPDPICDAAATDIRTGAACEQSASGIFAIKTEIDVWWQDDAVPPLVDPGRGTITVWLKGDITGVCQDGTGGVGVMQGCGTELPLFKSDANCDAFQIVFPDALWDQPTMPTFVTTGSTTGFNPGDILTIAMATGLVGIDLNDADINGTWPTTADNVTCEAGSVTDCFPDHDGDGKPGISVIMSNVGMNLTQDGCGGFNLPFVFRGAPLDALGALVDEGVKAENLYIGVRTRLGGAGAIGADCMSGTGDSQAEFVDSRVIGCTKEAPAGQPNAGVETDCTITDAQFVDSSAPIYNIIAKGAAPPTTVMVPGTQGGGSLDQTPSPGPRASLVRLGDSTQTFSCADVRNAAFPAFQ